MPPKQKDPRRVTFRKAKNTVKPGKVLWWGVFVVFLLTVLAGFIGAGYIYFEYSKDLPDVRQLRTFQPATITRVYSDLDELIAEFFVEKRIIVPTEKFPKYLIQATLAVEDSNFYSHFGVDPKAIFRALLTNIQAGHVVEGGSTITQQLSKTLFLSPARNLERKIKEAILSIRLEMIFTKDEILGLYLNQIYYGHGAYGVEAAAQTYFGKHVQDLTLEECAMIAGLPKAPNNYSPYRSPEKAKIRRNHSIRRMATLNFINEEQTIRALQAKFNLQGIEDPLNKAPYFIEHIRQFIQEKYGATKLYRHGLNVHTTLNLDMQNHARAAVQENLRILDKRFGYRGPLDHVDFPPSSPELISFLSSLNDFQGGNRLMEGAVLKGVVTAVDDAQVWVHLGNGQGIIDIKDMNWAKKPNVKTDGRWRKITNPQSAVVPGDVLLVRIKGVREEGYWSLALEQEPETQAGLLSLNPQGNIKAMIGGYEFSKSQFNRAVQAVRQPGSAFKPIVFAAAISEGYTPASVIMDSPVIFKEREQSFDKWKPVNFEEKFYGPTLLRTALAHSRNVVSIKLLQGIGVNKLVAFTRKFGVSSPLSKNLSIALGSSGLTLYELTSAYSVFANMGKRTEPIAVRHIKDRDGKIIYSAQQEVSQVIPAGVASIVSSMLESVVQEGTGSKAKVLKRPVAAKTGTTNNFIDAWFMGFTPELTTGVWVGKDKDESLGYNETGARAAIPIWLQFMKESLKGAPVVNFPTTPETVHIKIDPKTGTLADFGVSGSQFDVFLIDNPPTKNTGISPKLAGKNF